MSDRRKECGALLDPYGHRKPKTPEQVAETLRRATA
jgi:hypothetical protein